MSTPEGYQQRAAELLRIAQDTEDPASKALLLEMAQVWVSLAERVRERERDTDK